MTKQCTEMHQSSLLICFQIAFKRDLLFQIAGGHRLRQINNYLSAWAKNQVTKTTKTKQLKHTQKSISRTEHSVCITGSRGTSCCAWPMYSHATQPHAEQLWEHDMLPKLLYELKIPCSKKSSKFPLQLEKKCFIDSKHGAAWFQWSPIQQQAVTKKREPWLEYPEIL